MKSKCRIDDVGRECAACHVYQVWDNFRKGGGPRHKGSSCRKCAQRWTPDRKHHSPHRIDAEGRECNDCRKYKPWSEYNKDLSRPQGHDVRCKSCHSVGRFSGKYGITPEDYQKLSREQLGVCAICGNPETAIGSGGTVRPLSVDHDHATDRVRGLLCSKCNTALGLMDDSVSRFAQAIEYLSRRDV